LLEKFIL